MRIKNCGRKLFFGLGCLVMLGCLLLSLRYYPIAIFGVLDLALLFFFMRFERRPVKTEEIVLIGLLSAAAALVRIPFGPWPSVQPTSFLVIMTALVFGHQTGFMVGALAALLSNFFLGQGPWTPWQMFAWGMMGLSAGLLSSELRKNTYGRLLFGFLWGFVFGWFLNLWYLFLTMPEGFWGMWLASCVASFPLDLSHAVSNVFFLATFGKPWLNLFSRVKNKYGLSDEQ